MNFMLKTTYGKTVNYLCVKAHVGEEIAKGLLQCGVEVKSFRPGEMTLEDLPEGTRQEVKSKLEAYDRAYVDYENGKFEVSVGCSLLAKYPVLAKYPDDYFCCGAFEASKVFTREERRKIFEKLFGYVPLWLN